MARNDFFFQTTAKKDYLNGLRNLAFQLFTGLSAVLTQMPEPIAQPVAQQQASPAQPDAIPSPFALETSTPIKTDLSLIRAVSHFTIFVLSFQTLLSMILV